MAVVNECRCQSSPIRLLSRNLSMNVTRYALPLLIITRYSLLVPRPHVQTTNIPSRSAFIPPRLSNTPLAPISKPLNPPYSPVYVLNQPRRPFSHTSLILTPSLYHFQPLPNPKTPLFPSVKHQITKSNQNHMPQSPPKTGMKVPSQLLSPTISQGLPNPCSVKHSIHLAL